MGFAFGVVVGVVILYGYERRDRLKAMYAELKAKFGF